MAIVLPRANLNEQVYATLRSRILAREHGPGEKLSLHELAAELGVSRSPVHHALTRLVSEGLLTVKARRGYFVSPITTRVLVEGYEVRLALELHAADVTVETAEDERIEELGARLAATAEAISHEEWDTANAAFHETQVALAGNLLLLVLNLPLIGIWVKVLEIPRPQLYAGILVFATLGAYSLHQSVVDLAVLLVFGLLGFGMRRYGFPTAPAIIGLILGPMAETQLRRALSISQGDMTVFVERPISASFLALTLILLVAPVVVRRFRRARPARAAS